MLASDDEYVLILPYVLVYTRTFSKDFMYIYCLIKKYVLILLHMFLVSIKKSINSGMHTYS